MPFRGEQAPREESAEKLKNLEKQISERLNAEGVPVDDDCRIRMDVFNGVYPAEHIKEDIKLTEAREKKYKIGNEGSDGENFEVLKTIIFNKFLGNDFIVARASLFDDFINRVDNVILDKKTGNLVCALDEVADISGSEFEKKKGEVLNRNMKENENMLKYGLRMENGKIAPARAEHFPLFYLALPHNHIREAVNKIAPSLEEKSEYEKDLFSYFLASINLQIKTLKLYPHLGKPLKTSISLFENASQKFAK
jgi:hypothetical protein